MSGVPPFIPNVALENELRRVGNTSLLLSSILHFSRLRLHIAFSVHNYIYPT